jgi:tripartite-type tricarboxylate transporter receptor subunit TctC
VDVARLRCRCSLDCFIGAGQPTLSGRSYDSIDPSLDGHESSWSRSMRDLESEASLSMEEPDDGRRRRAIVAAIAASLAFAVPAVSAQTWPVRPIRFIVPTAAGGDVDYVARQLGRRIGESLGQNVIVENRPGAGAILGTDAVAKSAADGYTFGFVFSPHVGNPTLHPKLPYDTMRDFEYVSLVVQVPLLMVAGTSVPATSLRELIAYSKAQPTALNYASGAVADLGHITGERLKFASGLQMQHIPFKGGSAAMNDLLGGQIQLMIGSPAQMLPHLQTGKLKAIAVASASRAEALPQVPTMAEELGSPGFEMTSFYGVIAPAGTPRDVVERMSAEIAKALRAPDIADALRSRAFQSRGSSPAEFRAMVERSIAEAAAVIRRANIRSE